MAIYLDETQRAALARLRATWTWRTEWPTWLLIVVLYGSWLAIVFHIRMLGLPLATALLAAHGAWYMSLQHELLHGHPTRSPFINGMLGFMPFAVWFPYGIYRDAHLQHHDDAHLTQPDHDPESYFIDARAWQRAGPVTRALLTVRNTFIGRLLVGPAFSIAGTAADAARKFVNGDWRDMPLWIAHACMLIALTAWLDRVSGMPAWLFIFGVGYGALSISSVRSFYEHRAAHVPAHRSVLNETNWFWRALFLNNNYHLVHHDLPHVPWFALRDVYETYRQQYIERSGGFLVKGYSEWLKLYALTQNAHPVHGVSSSASRRIPAAAGSFAAKLRIKLMVVIRQGERYEAHPPASTERQSTRQALQDP
ncbi:fatty acid desaturase [Paraburkholderia sp.]|uniref:fatty acid desaturase n=1 Tax=Paraburkholderia sp. TaxID=1926495 RepID=UPI00239B2427|nr:fatty acid desaturase [Paraburkholderia sp.]MDE1182586.1 fatty acid desaturase [Paraburkholderia sp.]